MPPVVTKFSTVPFKLLQNFSNRKHLKVSCSMVVLSLWYILLDVLMYFTDKDFFFPIIPRNYVRKRYILLSLSNRVATFSGKGLPATKLPLLWKGAAKSSLFL